MAGVAAEGGAVLTLDAAREHLRVDDAAEDMQISTLILAAQDRIEGFLHRPLVGDGGWPTVQAVPAMVAHSVKLVLSDLYMNREAPTITDDQLRQMIGRHIRISVG